MKFLSAIQVSWVDFVTVLIVLVGIVRGRKRGLSEEILDTFKWLLIVVGCGYLYQPLGELMSEHSVFSLLFCYITVYLMLALLIHYFVGQVKKAMGDKLIGSDVFGRGEYYLGMMAGGLRWLCVWVFVLSILNARYYSAAEVRAREKYQQENFGDISFPTLSKVQAVVYNTSWTGKLAHRYLTNILIHPTPPGGKSLTSLNGPRRRLEGELNEVLEKR